MSIWYWNGIHPTWDGWIVLFDGENTYWSEEMRPSCNYDVTPLEQRGFIYIGEL